MRYLDQHIREVASGQRFLITRDEIFDLGGNKHIIESRIRRGLWQRVHSGVYQVDRRPLDWESELLAAVLGLWPGCAGVAPCGIRLVGTRWDPLRSRGGNSSLRLASDA